MVAFQLDRKAAAVLVRQHSTMGAIEDAQAIKASFQPEKHRRLVPFLYGTIVPTGSAVSWRGYSPPREEGWTRH
jgi:hypothetical protein